MESGVCVGKIVGLKVEETPVFIFLPISKLPTDESTYAQIEKAKEQLGKLANILVFLRGEAYMRD